MKKEIDVKVDIDDNTLLGLTRIAHGKDITLNALINEILLEKVNDRRVFHVEVGNLTIEDIKEVVEGIKKENKPETTSVQIEEMLNRTSLLQPIAETSFTVNEAVDNLLEKDEKLDGLEMKDLIDFKKDKEIVLEKERMKIDLCKEDHDLIKFDKHYEESNEINSLIDNMITSN